VRGRRFVRPTLTLTHKGTEVRALADLEHKPWAAEDGEVWRAAFNLDKGLDGAREIELSVAPDIVVELRPKGKKLARPGDLLSAGDAARAPRYKEDPPTAPVTVAGETARPGAPAETSGQATPVSASPSGRRRTLSHAEELERLGSRLAAANHDLEHERERRAALAKTLEDERSESRQLRTKLGQARSELEVAAAARAEAAAVEAELEDARRQLREIQRRHEDETASLARRHEQATQVSTREHEQLTQAHAALQDELQQHAGALESTQEALATERAEAGRLRNRLTQSQEARERLAAPAATGGPTSGADAGPTEPRVSRRATSRAAAREREAARERGAERERGAGRRREPERREQDPTATQPFDVLALDDLRSEPAAPAPSRSAGRRGTAQPHEQQTASSVPQSERLRPLNPSLRHRTWWFGRLLALIVLLGVIAAVYMVLHSTVLH
jgi:hypothetical protein